MCRVSCHPQLKNLTLQDMKIAFLMDPLESMNLNKDTSYALMKAALQLNAEVYHFMLGDLSLKGDQPLGRLRKLAGLAADGRPVVGDTQVMNLNELDAIWIRKDPPFDRRYFYSTLFLDFLDPKVFVINRSASLRDLNEKLAALNFVRDVPKTLISSDRLEILEFVAQFSKSVLKPLDGFGGKGIEFVSADDEGLDEKIDQLTHQGSRWIVVNDFVEGAKLGDKRILLVEGEPIGAILRKSETGELHNMDQGGKAHPAELTEVDKRVCADMKPFLIENKLFFVGIDMLGDSLTEINVTSPTGLQELSRFSKRDWPTDIIQRIFQLCEQPQNPFA